LQRAAGMKAPLLAIVAVAGVTGAAGPAHAGVFDIAGGLGATTSAWSDDTGASTSLKLGYFFDRVPWLAPIFVGRIEFAQVDDRMVEYFSAGAEAMLHLGPVRGYARAALVHCHEVSRSAFADEPVQSILGVGDGLRHRAGGNLGLGVELPVKRYATRSDLYLALDVGGTAFADDRGPRWYVSGTLGLGIHWARGAAARHPHPQVARE